MSAEDTDSVKCEHRSGWHGPLSSFCDGCGWCGRCNGTGFSAVSGARCRPCKGIGNEQGDTTRTNARGTSILELIGHPTEQSRAKERSR